MFSAVILAMNYYLDATYLWDIIFNLFRRRIRFALRRGFFRLLL